MNDAITLSDVIAGNLQIEWQEAIAIVREVVASMFEDGSRGSVVPELHHIRISPDGRVDLLGGTRTSEPVRRLGQLLQAMLGQSEPPVQLRLIVSQAIAATPVFGSVAELDQSLAYFERPDRRAVRRELYARAARLPARGEPTGAPSLDVIAPLVPSEEEEPAPAPDANSARRRARQLIALAALVAIVAAVGVRYRQAADVRRGADIAVFAQSSFDQLGLWVRSMLSLVSERGGFGRLIWSDTEPGAPAPASAPAEVVPEPSPAPVRRSAPSEPPQGVTRSVPLPSRTADIPLLAFDLDVAVPAADASRITIDARVARLPVLEIAPDGFLDAVDPLTIYTPESADVLPPVAIRPQLPTELPPGIRLEDLTTIELVVSTTGGVDGVKLLGLAQGVRDWLWLSAVKAWQFRPAIKEGHPVRYRKIVWIAR